VTDSRRERASIRRRYQCPECQRRFTTYEAQETQAPVPVVPSVADPIVTIHGVRHRVLVTFDDGGVITKPVA
jgi:hypothetical protein